LSPVLALEFVWTVLEVKLAGSPPLPRTNLLDLSKKKSLQFNLMRFLQKVKLHKLHKLHKIPSKLESTNLRNGTTKQEQGYPWKAVSDSAVEHTDDHHLELLLGLRHSILSVFGTDSVPVNRYLASCYEPTYTYIISRTKKSMKHYAAPLVHIHVHSVAHFHTRAPIYFKNMHSRVSTLFLNTFPAELPTKLNLSV
jgi:hypothetical protein